MAARRAGDGAPDVDEERHAGRARTDGRGPRVGIGGRSMQEPAVKRNVLPGSRPRQQRLAGRVSGRRQVAPQDRKRGRRAATAQRRRAARAGGARAVSTGPKISPRCLASIGDSYQRRVRFAALLQRGGGAPPLSLAERNNSAPPRAASGAGALTRSSTMVGPPAAARYVTVARCG